MKIASVMLASTLLVAGFADLSAAQTEPPATRLAVTKSKADSHKRVSRRGLDTRKIACTHTGCIPIPSNCTTTMEETWQGPTGYEIVNCP